MRRYLFFDYITQGYLVVVGLLLILGGNERVDHWPALLAAHACGVGLIHLLIQLGSRPTPPAPLRLVRYFYPMFLYALFYRESEYLNQMFVHGYLDPTIIRWEEMLFGGQPSLSFMDRLPWLLVSESFYAAYLSFYLMIGGLGIYLYAKNRDHFTHYLSVTTGVFCVCYFCFIFLPIIGPRLFFGELAGYSLPASVMPEVVPAYPASVLKGVLYRVTSVIYEHLEGTGGSVPSSHAAVALCTVWFSFRYARKIRHIHLAVAIWLCLATVYCRYHYAIDLLTGCLAAGILIPAFHYWYVRTAPQRGKQKSGN
jgi:membrane-associated phospholipid phosphatase